MTFRDVIKKNFVGDLSKYVSYFFSGVFCVAMFFTYSTLVLLDEIKDSVESYPMEILMITTCAITVLFSIFFINYSHGNFIRNKKKELATYMVLGMNENDGIKLLAVETAIIGLSSIVVGIVTGLLFSRLFQVIALKIVDIENQKFRLEPWNFIATFFVFVALYVVSFIVSAIKLKKEDLTTIMKDNRKKEGKKFGVFHVCMFVIGVALLTFSIVFIYNVAPDKTINYKGWVTGTFLSTGFIGLILSINFGVGCLIAFSKKKKSYYENMLAVTGMDYKYRQNTRIITILALLAAMIVLLVGSPISLLSISESIAEEGSNDIEFLIPSDMDDKDVLEIVDGETILEDEITELAYVKNSDNKLCPIVPASEFNEKYDAKFNPSDGQIMVGTISWVPGNNGYKTGDILALSGKTASIELEIAGFESSDFECKALFTSGVVFVVSDQEFEAIKEKLFFGRLHSIDFAGDWKRSDDTVAKVTEVIGEQGVVNSRFVQFETLKHGYSMFLFTSCSMCFMFFVSTGFVLYFKQFNDIEEEKKQYIQLYKMGISDKVIKKSIRNKMAVVYFTPLFGSIMGIAVMYYLSNLFGGDEIVREFMSKSVIGLFLYAGSQVLFYLVLKFNYTKEVLSTEI